MQYSTENPENTGNNQNAELIEQISGIYEALVNTIVPRSPELAETYGNIQYYGALDVLIQEYVIYALDSLPVPLAIPTAELITIAVKQVDLVDRNLTDSDYAVGNDRIDNLYYAMDLNPNSVNLLYALSLLMQLQINITELPIPFKNNQLLVASVISSLNNTTMMGYYSEWAGYGTTRLLPPQVRVLEYYPISWEQVGYPGPSKGYRALREYHFTE